VLIQSDGAPDISGAPHQFHNLHHQPNSTPSIPAIHQAFNAFLSSL
jgi:hypothetical protein